MLVTRGLGGRRAGLATAGLAAYLITTPPTPEPEPLPGGVGGGLRRQPLNAPSEGKHWRRLKREDEEILKIITAFLEKMDP